MCFSFWLAASALVILTTANLSDTGSLLVEFLTMLQRCHFFRSREFCALASGSPVKQHAAGRDKPYVHLCICLCAQLEYGTVGAKGLRRDICWHLHNAKRFLYGTNGTRGWQTFHAVVGFYNFVWYHYVPVSTVLRLDFLSPSHFPTFLFVDDLYVYQGL